MKQKIICILIVLLLIFCYFLNNKDTFQNLNSYEIIIIGNAPYNKKDKNGTIIDNFNKVIRFNSFSTEGHEEYIGSKITDWVVSDSYCVLEKKHFLNTLRKYPNINLVIVLPAVFKDNVKKLKAELPEEVFNKANIIIQDKDIFVDEKYNFGRRWPSTGILAIYNYLSSFKQVTITGFNHFDPKEKTIHYYEKRKQIGHQHNLEKKIVDELVNQGKVLRL